MSGLEPIALAMMVAGQVMGGIEANRGARAQAAADEENARRGILAGEQEGLQVMREERRMTGDMIASMAGSGVGMGSGTASDLIEENAYQRELEIYGIRTRAAGEADALYQQAQDKRAAGKAALIGSIFSAGATAIKGASDMRERGRNRDATRAGWTPTGGGTRTVPKMRVKGG